MRPLPVRLVPRTASLAVALSTCLGVLGSCGDSSDDGSAAANTTASPLELDVVAQYAKLVRANYADTVTSAQALKVAVDALIAAPSVVTLEAAQVAWRAARVPYGQTEAFRFYGGPIDDDTTGLEGFINGWPLDESFIDYVEGGPEAGIINQPDRFPNLTESVLQEQNENGGEDYLSTGYHAIEFLLWGQDLNADGPGQRTYTDYVKGAEGPGVNADRRGTYLGVATQLLVEQLTEVAAGWKPGASYGDTFLQDEKRVSLTDMLIGLEKLSGKELSGERMNAAIKSGDQEDEHSCFSDNTHVDYAMNALGLENVYLGRYGEDDGPGIDDLVKAVDPALDTAMTDALSALKDAVKAIPVPVDTDLLSEAGRAKIKVASDAAVDVHDLVVKITTALKL